MKLQKPINSDMMVHYLKACHNGRFVMRILCYTVANASGASDTNNILETGSVSIITQWKDRAQLGPLERACLYKETVTYSYM
jgi:hypothetical protein